jgi:hypothetical protein
MNAHTFDIQLAICGQDSLSHTRVTRGETVVGTPVPEPPERRSHTRVTSGPPEDPPPKDYEISDEGPALPALRRFGG